MSAPILIVDDSRTVRGHLGDLLREDGFEVVEAPDLAGARECLRQVRPSLLLLDVHLPDGLGFELLDPLPQSEAGEPVPVVFLSQEQDVAHHLAGHELGAVAYVGKPYREEEILWLARTHAKRKRDVGPSILVIDDSRTERESLRACLVEHGYRVVLAASGEEGLETARRAIPDLVIVDGQLPGMNGAAVLQRIRRDPVLRTLPCLMRTGSQLENAEVEALDAGADGYITKSRDLDVLLARIKALLDRAIESPMLTATGRPAAVLLVVPGQAPRRRLGASLRDAGFAVVETASVDEAQELLEASATDVVLVHAAVATAMIEFVRGREELREIAVVSASQDDGASATLASIQRGADDHVALDAPPDALRARLAAQARRYRMEREKRAVKKALVAAEVEAERARAARALADQRAAFIESLEDKALELERAREVAQRESEFKGRFLANISHELRTPLNAILGFTDLLVGGAVDPASELGKKHLEHVAGSARHLLALVNDVLDLSKAEAGKIDLEPEPVELEAFFTGILGQLDPLATKKGVMLRCEGGGDAVAHFDRRRITQVLYNLLSNAIKFTPEGGTVDLAFTNDARTLTIRVIDTGVGIAPEDLHRVFLEFEQVSGAHRVAANSDAPAAPGPPKAGGTGLGLPLALRLVEAHGGRLDVESVVDRGSVFTVVLPWSRDGQARPVTPLATEEAPATRALRVLLVEDNDLNVELVRTVLMIRDHEVVACGTVAEARLRLASDPPYDVALLDVQLPDGGGHELIGPVRERDPGTKVIAFTASTGEFEGEHRFDAVMRKPIDVAAFTADLERRVRG